MRLEVYDGKKSAEQVVRLRLLPSGDGRTAIILAVDEHGTRIDQGHLATLVAGDDGFLSLRPACNAAKQVVGPTGRLQVDDD